MKHLTEAEIQEYLDGIVSANKQEIITHLDSCRQCQSKLAQYKLLYSQLAADEPAELSPDFSKSVMARIQTESTKESARPIWSVLLSFAGTILGLLTIGYFVNFAPLLELIKTAGIKEYFDRILFSKIGELAAALNIDTYLIIYTGLILIAVGAIDYIIRHYKRRPVSFLV